MAQAAVARMREPEAPLPVIKKTPWGRRILKHLVRAAVVVVVLIFCAQMAWKVSGSNQWEPVLDKDGVRVYSLKAPGSDLVQFKAVGRIHSTLSGTIAWMKDPDACKVQDCTESYAFEQDGDQLQYNYFQYEYGFFGNRDFVIRSVFYQNPTTKQVLLTVAALADRLPLRKGFTRVTNMNNKWVLTSLGDGQIQVVIENNFDPGGYLPNFLFNRRRPRGMYNILTNLQEWVNKPKYQNTHFSFIDESPGAFAHRDIQSIPTD